MSKVKDNLNIWGGVNIGFGNDAPAGTVGEFNILSDSSEPIATFRKTNTGDPDLDSLIRLGYDYNSIRPDGPYLALTDENNAPVIALEQIGTGSLGNPENGVIISGNDESGGLSIVSRNNGLTSYPFLIQSNGTISAGATPDYAGLVTNPNVLTNKGYVDNSPIKDTWVWDGSINNNNIASTQDLRRHNGAAIGSNPYASPFNFEIYGAVGSNRRTVSTSWNFVVRVNGNIILTVPVSNGSAGVNLLSSPIQINAFDDVVLRIESPAGTIPVPGGSIWCRRT